MNSNNLNNNIVQNSTSRIIASFDIGIKNMAYCVLCKNGTNVNEIIDWGIISMLEPPSVMLTCCAILQNKKKKTTKDVINAVCGNKAFFYSKKAGMKEYYCKKHTDKTKIITLKEYTGFKNKTMDKMREFATLKGIQLEKQEDTEKLTRKKMIEIITMELDNNFYMPLSVGGGFVPAIDAKELDLITAGRNMTKELDRIFVNSGILYKLTDVFIENQISTIATRMKTIQGMLTQYFIIRGTNVNNLNIKYISASLKLRGKIDKKTTYSERKKRGIEICETILKENENVSVNKWLPFFKNYGVKKDDLADSFLQGIAVE